MGWLQIKIHRLCLHIQKKGMWMETVYIFKYRKPVTVYQAENGVGI